VGHTLGAQHEYNRPYTSPECNANPPPARWDSTWFGEYDTDSVMNGAGNCSTAYPATNLSETDAFGIRMAYGAPNDRLAGTWAGPGWRFWWFNIDGLQRYESDRATWTYFGTDADTPISGAWGAGEGGYIEKIGTFRNGEWRLDMNANGVWNAGVDRVVTGFGGAGSISGRSM
jgi:hypothetical protein